jgi:NTE family protein
LADLLEEQNMPTNDRAIKPTAEGIGLCLSGGGFRAMLFHLGVLWRLNELGYLRKIDRISSVSGGSITAAWLGLKWKKLRFNNHNVAENLVDEVVMPLRKFSEKKLDVWIVVFGLLNPFSSVGDRLISAYRKHLFGDATLQDMPEEPRFVINASNAQSGVLWRFSKSYMGDYLVGRFFEPKIELAVAVAASSAFPPFLSPVRLRLNSTDYTSKEVYALHEQRFTTNVILMDGGVYDNLGLEPLIKRYDTILVSDAGGKIQPDPKPKLFWGFQAFRVLNMVDNQVRSLRKRDIIEMFELRNQLLKQGMKPDDEAVKLTTRKGAYWGTFSDISDYELADALDSPYKKTIELAKLSTRLWTFSKEDQERLINWGYAVCDAAMRKHVDFSLGSPKDFPYPQVGV